MAKPVHSNDEPILEDDPALREALKRCSPATYQAACRFRSTGDTGALRAVMGGLIERFVDRELRAKVSGPADAGAALRLREDLGLDSLTMMEVVMLAEEVLPVTISNEELIQLHTLGEVHDFILAKVAAARREPVAGEPGQAGREAAAPAPSGATSSSSARLACLPTAVSVAGSESS